MSSDCLKRAAEVCDDRYEEVKHYNAVSPERLKVCAEAILALPPCECATRIAYLEAQERLLQTWQDKYKAEKARADEVVRPLDEQMARLNESLIVANARADVAERRVEELMVDYKKLQKLCSSQGIQLMDASERDAALTKQEKL